MGFSAAETKECVCAETERQPQTHIFLSWNVESYFVITLRLSRNKYRRNSPCAGSRPCWDCAWARSAGCDQCRCQGGRSRDTFLATEGCPEKKSSINMQPTDMSPDIKVALCVCDLRTWLQVSYLCKDAPVPASLRSAKEVSRRQERQDVERELEGRKCTPSVTYLNEFT